MWKNILLKGEFLTKTIYAHTLYLNRIKLYMHIGGWMKLIIKTENQKSIYLYTGKTDKNKNIT